MTRYYPEGCQCGLSSAPSWVWDQSAAKGDAEHLPDRLGGCARGEEYIKVADSRQEEDKRETKP